MPTTRAGGGGTAAGSLRLKTRSIVSRDQGADRRAIMREPGLPPRANATARTSALQRPTLRPYRRPTGGASGSLNVPVGQDVCMHRNRRTDSRSLTVLPLTGRSESVRSYRLCRDVDGIAQSGQFAPTAAKRPDISTIPSLTVRRSTIGPW